MKYPKIRTNVLIDGKYGIEHYYNFPLNSVFECDYTGAVYLMTNEVTKKCRYDFHEFGEDIPFCISAKENGFKLFVHSGLIQNHIMCEYQQYCIDNCCQNPCMRVGNNITYQYKYLDNIIYPDLFMCPKLKKGNKSVSNYI
jgi:hypothetical protein